MTFAERLKHLRLQAGLFRRELAQQAGLSMTCIADLECGRTQPKLETIERLAVALGTNCLAFAKQTFEAMPSPRVQALPKCVRCRRRRFDNGAIREATRSTQCPPCQPSETIKVEIDMNFGKRLRQLRLQAGLKQTAIANRAGVSFALISSLERGKVQPLWKTVERLARALRIESLSLANGTLGSPEPPPEHMNQECSRPSMQDAAEPVRLR